MASVPTTATCWVMSERLSVRRNRSLRQAEDDHRDDKHEGGAERRVAVEDVAYPAERGRAVEELLGQVGAAAGRLRSLLGHVWS